MNHFSRIYVVVALVALLTCASAQDPQLEFYQSPTYPLLARLARIAGTVVLSFTVDPNGKPSNIKIISGHPLLSTSAKDNLSTWKFSVDPQDVQPGSRLLTFVFEFSEDWGDDYYDPKKERVSFEGPNLVRVRTAPSGKLSAQDCPDSPIAGSNAPITPLDFVKLARTSCYGTCPSYEVALFGDGAVVWQGYGFVDSIGERKFQIATSDAEKMIQRFRSTEVLGLCGNYSRSVTDSPSTTTIINVSRAQKTIHDYASSSPQWFRKLQDDLDSVALTHQMRHGDPATEPLVHIQEEYLSKPGMTALMRAAAQSDLAAVRKLLAEGARIEAVDASGWTALMYAAAAYSTNGVVEELLRAGANRNHISPFGDTVLMASALQGSFDKDLAKGGPDINAQNHDGVTVLMLLAATGRGDEIRAALRFGAKTTIKDQSGRTALDYLDAIPCHKSLIRGHKQFMEITGPCSSLDKNLRKARSLLLSAFPKK
ncbi:TonB family protein [Bryobacter aggregatus]|uniref:TonB family protein n=1 Tax=Bryobacter aggregatus TaxID=360054 RepID=UPI001EE397DB|nr:TonB family protein [Bryobacter aggregatus]